MAIDPALLEQVLRTPDSRDVRSSPVVTAVILSDPRNAAALVPALDEIEGIRSRNARRILCLFGAAAVPPLVGALLSAGVHAREAGIDIIWSMMLGENDGTVRRTLTEILPDMHVLLEDKLPLPEPPPDHMEKEFSRRICDHAFIALQELLDPDFDDFLFLSMDDRDRDEDIKRFKARGIGLRNA